MDRLTSEKHNRFRETPQDNFHDHTIFPPDDEFYPVFQSESLRNQVPSIGKETHLGVRNPFSVDKGLDRIFHKLWEEDIPGKRHVEQYLRNQRRRNLRPSTMRNSFNIIYSFLRGMKEWNKNHLEQIDRADLARFVEDEQDRGSKASTVRMRLACVKAFIRFLIEGGVVHPEVLAKRMIIKVPDSLPRAMELDDEKRLISVVDDIRNRAMILLLLRTGMRIGELLNTLVRDVNLKERKIEIWEAQKNRVGRVVYFSDDALGALKAWLKIRDPKKELIFYAMGRDAMSYSAARAMFCKYLNKAGLSHKSYTLHCLRHSNASSLLNAGIPLECLKELLGHNSVEVTRRYARLTNATREKEYFKAMSKIERGEVDGYYRVDLELQKILEEKKLFSSYREELPEHP
jgi:integrase/recombinase XerD